MLAGVVLTGYGRLIAETFTLPSAVRSLREVDIGGLGNVVLAFGGVPLPGAGLLGGFVPVAAAGIGFFAGSTRFVVAGGGFEGIPAAGRALGIEGRLFFAAPLTAEAVVAVVLEVPFAVFFTALLGCTAVFLAPEPYPVPPTGPSAAIEFLTASP